MKDSVPAAAMPRSGALRREIVVLLCVKVSALTLLYLIFFGPSSRPHITPPGFAAHLLAPAHTP